MPPMTATARTATSAGRSSRRRSTSAPPITAYASTPWPGATGPRSSSPLISASVRRARGGRPAGTGAGAGAGAAPAGRASPPPGRRGCGPPTPRPARCSYSPSVSSPSPTACCSRASTAHRSAVPDPLRQLVHARIVDPRAPAASSLAGSPWPPAAPWHRCEQPAVRAPVRARPRPRAHRLDQRPGARRQPRAGPRRPTSSATCATGWPSTTACPASPAPRPPCSSAPWRPRPQRLRVGSGGVMLPNHAPLVVAEQFGMLEALHPGRIDLGIGRAPGTDGRTAAALRRSVDGLSADEFPQQLVQLRGFFRGPGAGADRRAGAGQRAGRLAARLERLQRAGRRPPRPAVRLRPPLQRPEHAARPGAVPRDVPAVRGARASRTRWSAPRCSSPTTTPPPAASRCPAGCRSCACAAARPARSRRSRRRCPTRTARPSAPSSRTGSTARSSAGRRRSRQGLEDLLDATQADELMVTTLVHDPADRLRSYRLLAQLSAGVPA